jgi:hypothetical protein
MSRRKVCGLSFVESVTAVRNWNGKIMYQRGVWNPYAPEQKENALKRIASSGFGADVYADDETDTLYVSQPVASDMW